MDKKTKIVLGVAAIGVAGYLYYQSTQPKTTGFANATGRNMMAKKKRKKNIVGNALIAQDGKFANMSGMHMMPDGTMMKNSDMNLSGTVEAHQSTFNASGHIFAPSTSSRVFNASGNIFAPTAPSKVFNNIVGDDLIAQDGKFANMSGM
jgi:hypothetical protein